jgi:hypothetical protein
MARDGVDRRFFVQESKLRGALGVPIQAANHDKALLGLTEAQAECDFPCNICRS